MYLFAYIQMNNLMLMNLELELCWNGSHIPNKYTQKVNAANTKQFLLMEGCLNEL